MSLLIFIFAYYTDKFAEKSGVLCKALGIDDILSFFISSLDYIKNFKK